MNRYEVCIFDCSKITIIFSTTIFFFIAYRYILAYTQYVHYPSTTRIVNPEDGIVMKGFPHRTGAHWTGIAYMFSYLHAAHSVR